MVLKASKKKFGKAFFDRVNDQLPELRKKLEAARASWEDEFWKLSELKNARKAETAEATYEDGTGAPLTADEAAALKTIVEKLNGNAWSQALYDEMSAMLSAGWESAAEMLDIVSEFETVPAIALAEIRKHAEQFAFMVNQREQQAMFDVIDAALAEGQTPRQLANVISDTFAEGYHVTGEIEEKDDAGKVTGTHIGVVKRTPTDTWSEMVARTELSRAQTLGQVALYRAAEIQKVMWVTTQGANVCDICQPADGQIVDLGDAFPSVDIDMPPAHPNCCCALMAADEDVAYEPAA